jgi:SNF2 family DNA or RNA helicase
MELDNRTYLIYDKFAGNHTYYNPLTISVTIEDIFTQNLIHKHGKTAIEYSKEKFKQMNALPENLDLNMYDVSIYTTVQNNVEHIYTIIGIKNDTLYDCVTNKLEIPNYNFLTILCRYHISYIKAITQGKTLKIGSGDDQIINENTNKIIEHVMNDTNHIADPIIADPAQISVQLYSFQKRSIYWLLQKELNIKKIAFNLNDEISFGKIYFDVVRQTFNTSDDRKIITFYGACLTDEVGLGKTIQITTLAILNPPQNLSYLQPTIDPDKLFSKGTLVLCPNQLCGQWKREFGKMIKPEYGANIITILTKVHYDKYTYKQLCDADFVLVSYSFLDNQAFLKNWMTSISSSKSYHRSPMHEFDTISVKKILTEQGKKLVSTIETSLSNPMANLLLIHWNRIVVDEFHEIYTVNKHSHMMNLLPLFSGHYRWVVTGTPFEKSSNCLNKMVDFITNYTNRNNDKILLNKSITNYLMNDCFRRNTKKSVKEEFQLPPIEEEIVWLKFSPTERMMYNAYLANPNNDKYGIFLRQLCCHPKLAEETKLALSNCKTLEDIEKMMVNHYKSVANNSYIKVRHMQKRIKVVNKKIKKIERKQEKQKLKKAGLLVDDEDIESELDSDSDSDSDLDFEDDYDEIMNNDLTTHKNDHNIHDSDDEAKISEQKNKKEKEPVQKKPKEKQTDDDILAQILSGNGTEPVKSITLDNLKNSLIELNNKLVEINKDYNGKKTTYDFYKNVVDRIRKTTTMETNESDNSDDEEEEETCGICLSDICGDDVGVTKCGHIFCYNCIKMVVQQKHQCPYCQKGLKDEEIFMISYETKKKTVFKNQEEKNKEAMINEIGTKLTNLILYLKKNDKHTILFSQWDDLLRKIGKILSNNGIQNVFCRGNVYQRDKAIREFNGDDKIKVIMLSSESAASGTNLTKATQVILLDQVFGSYEYRRNTEYQAIGRAHRLGQTNIVKVVRFIVRDTVEDEIYNANKVADAVHIANMKIFEIDDDNITMTESKNDPSDELVDELIDESSDEPKKKPMGKKKIANNK